MSERMLRDLLVVLQNKDCTPTARKKALEELDRVISSKHCGDIINRSKQISDDPQESISFKSEIVSASWAGILGAMFVLVKSSLTTENAKSPVAHKVLTDGFTLLRKIIDKAMRDDPYFPTLVLKFVGEVTFLNKVGTSYLYPLLEVFSNTDRGVDHYHACLNSLCFIFQPLLSNRLTCAALLPIWEGCIDVISLLLKRCLRAGKSNLQTTELDRLSVLLLEFVTCPGAPLTQRDGKILGICSVAFETLLNKGSQPEMSFDLGTSGLALIQVVSALVRGVGFSSLQQIHTIAPQTIKIVLRSWNLRKNVIAVKEQLLQVLRAFFIVDPPENTATATAHTINRATLEELRECVFKDLSDQSVRFNSAASYLHFIRGDLFAEVIFRLQQSESNSRLASTSSSRGASPDSDEQLEDAAARKRRRVNPEWIEICDCISNSADASAWFHGIMVMCHKYPKVGVPPSRRALLLNVLLKSIRGHAASPLIWLCRCLKAMIETENAVLAAAEASKTLGIFKQLWSAVTSMITMHKDSLLVENAFALLSTILQDGFRGPSEWREKPREFLKLLVGPPSRSSLQFVLDVLKSGLLATEQSSIQASVMRTSLIDWILGGKDQLDQLLLHNKNLDLTYRSTTSWLLAEVLLALCQAGPWECPVELQSSITNQPEPQELWEEAHRLIEHELSLLRNDRDLFYFATMVEPVAAVTGESAPPSIAEPTFIADMFTSVTHRLAERCAEVQQEASGKYTTTVLLKSALLTGTRIKCHFLADALLQTPDCEPLEEETTKLFRDMTSAIFKLDASVSIEDECTLWNALQHQLLLQVEPLSNHEWACLIEQSAKPFKGNRRYQEYLRTALPDLVKPRAHAMSRLLKGLQEGQILSQNLSNHTEDEEEFGPSITSLSSATDQSVLISGHNFDPAQLHKISKSHPKHLVFMQRIRCLHTLYFTIFKADAANDISKYFQEALDQSSAQISCMSMEMLFMMARWPSRASNMDLCCQRAQRIQSLMLMDGGLFLSMLQIQAIFAMDHTVVHADFKESIVPSFALLIEENTLPVCSPWYLKREYMHQVLVVAANRRQFLSAQFGEDDELTTVSQYALRQLQADDFGTQCEAISSIALLFATPPAPPQAPASNHTATSLEMQAQLFASLLSTTSSRYTRLAVLLQCSRACPLSENEVLLQLCITAAEHANPQSGTTISACSHAQLALQQLAQQWSFANAKELLVDNLAMLMQHWFVSTSRSVLEFPFRLLEVDSKEKFMHQYGRDVVPQLLFEQDGPVHVTKRTVEDHFIPIMAYVFPQMFASETKEDAKRVRTCLEKFLGQSAFMRMLRAQMNGIIDLLIWVCAGGEEEAHRIRFYLNRTRLASAQQLVAVYNFKQLQRCFEYISSPKFDDCQCALLYVPARLTDVLLNTQVRGQARKRLTHRRQCIIAYSRSVQAVHDSLHKHPAALHDMIAALARFMNDPDLSSLSLELARHIIQAANRDHVDLREQFAQHAHLLWAFLATYALKGDGPDAATALQLLDELVTIGEADVKLQLALQEVEPFFAEQQLASVWARMEELRSQYSEDHVVKLEALERLIQEGPSLPAFVRVGVVERVRLTIRSAGSVDSALLASITRSLVVMGSVDQDKHVRHAIAVCLGELGIVDLGSVEGKFAVDAQFYSDMNKSLLYTLDEYVKYPDAKVADAAMHTLKLVCQHKEMRQGLDPSPVKKRYNWLLHGDFVGPDRPIPADLVDWRDPETWNPLRQSDYDTWMQQLSTSLVLTGVGRSAILQSLWPLCMVSAKFAAQVMPWLVFDVVETSDNIQVVQRAFHDFFESAASGHLPRLAVMAMTNVLVYLRMKADASEKDLHRTWIEVNLEQVASSTQQTEAHCTALFFAELWWRDQFQWLTVDEVVSSTEQDQEEWGLEKHPIPPPQQTIQHMVQLLGRIYQDVSEPDGFYGVNTGFDVKSRLQKYEHEGEWGSAVGLYDAQLQVHPGNAHSLQHLATALHELGYAHILQSLFHTSTLPNNNEHLADLQAEAAWRQSQWDVVVQPASSDISLNFHQSVHSALKLLRKGDRPFFMQTINGTRERVIASLQTNVLESTKPLYPILAQLQCLFELEETYETRWIRRRTEDMSEDMPTNSSVIEDEISSLSARWLSRSSNRLNDYTLHDMVLSLRTVALERIQAPGLYIEDQWLLQSELARREGKLQRANNVLVRLSARSTPTGKVPSDWPRIFQEAKQLWSQNDRPLALRYLREHIVQLEGFCRVSQIDSFESCDGMHLLENFDSNYTPAAKLIVQQRSAEEKRDIQEHLADALRLSAEWSAEVRDRSPQEIIQRFSRAADIARYVSENAVGLAVYSFAKYADSHLQHLRETNAAQSCEEFIAQMEQELLGLRQISVKKGSASSHDVQVRQSDLQKQITAQKQTKSNAENLVRQFLQASLSNYSRALQLEHETEFTATRLVALWMNNCTETYVNDLMKQYLPGINTVYFVPMMYQLAARIGNTSNPSMQTTLQQVILSAACEHPYHVLYIIYALANANRGTPNNRPGTQSAEAKEILDKVKTRGNLDPSLAHLTNIVRQVQLLCDCYNEVAFQPMPEKGKLREIPKNLRIFSVENMKEVPVPTIELPLQKDGNYQGYVFVHCFGKETSTPGGINMPTKLMCVGSDGRQYNQLVKGQDDLRQDAVMQQVFETANRLLARQPATKSRRLHVRTYRVIPLSQKSGVLEWVDNTTTIGQYLCGNSKENVLGAHQRYRPHDITASKCRELLSKCAAEEKLKVYREIEQQFRPVLHYYFLERFAQPLDWFEKRLTYTRSVAANSAIGYIVGLGDRHVNNILIDECSAELIHIDLGIAFDQGRRLKSPELIPFRLTRDVVDGMGITGVEGVFRRCLEHTLAVLRESHDPLLTVLDVLLHDPLYNWTITAEKADTVQGAPRQLSLVSPSLEAPPSETTNPQAQRVLFRLRQKLIGVEDGVSLSVAGQAHFLIEDARNPQNLCRLFAGWQPYL